MRAQTPFLPLYTCRFFAVYGLRSGKKITLTMFVPAAYRYTSSISNIVQLVGTSLPSVLETTCFNDACLPFTQELQETELPHFFEHVILDLFCHMKAASTDDEVTMDGWTSWDWERSPEGQFEINFSCAKDDRVMLLEAIQQGILFVENVLSSAELSAPKSDPQFSAATVAAVPS